MVTTEMWSSVFKRRRLFHRQFFWNTLNFSSCQNWLPKQNFVQLVLVQLCSGRRSMWEAYYNKRDPLKILKCLPELVLSLKRDLNDHSTFCFAAQTKLSLNIMAEYHTLDSCNKRNKSLSSILSLSDLSVIEWSIHKWNYHWWFSLLLYHYWIGRQCRRHLKRSENLLACFFFVMYKAMVLTQTLITLFLL